MRELRRKFQHDPVYDICRGRIKVYCRCGSQSKRMFDNMGEAAKAHSTHVGLKELQKKALLT